MPLEQFEKNAYKHNPRKPKLSRARLIRMIGFDPITENVIDGDDAPQVRRLIEAFVSEHHQPLACSCDPIDDPNSRTCFNNNCINRQHNVECGKGCGGTTSQCRNQGLANRDWKQMRLISYAEAGFGVEAAENILQGELITEYQGRLYTKKGNPHDGKSKYNMDLIKAAPGRSAIVVEPTERGNFSRFMQHSHSPNAGLFPMLVGKEIRMAIYALKPIPPRMSITYDYGCQYRRLGVMKCRCLDHLTCPDVFKVLEERPVKKPERPLPSPVRPVGTMPPARRYVDLVPAELYPHPHDYKPCRRNTKAEDKAWNDHFARTDTWYRSWQNEEQERDVANPDCRLEAEREQRAYSTRTLPAKKKRVKKVKPPQSLSPNTSQAIALRTRGKQQQLQIASQPPASIPLFSIKPVPPSSDPCSSSAASQLISLSVTPGTPTITSSGRLGTTSPQLNLTFDSGSFKIIPPPLPPAVMEQFTMMMGNRGPTRGAITYSQVPKRTLPISPGTPTQSQPLKRAMRKTPPKSTPAARSSPVEEDCGGTSLPTQSIGTPTPRTPSPRSPTSCPPTPRSPTSRPPSAGTPRSPQEPTPTTSPRAPSSSRAMASPQTPPSARSPSSPQTRSSPCPTLPRTPGRGSPGDYNTDMETDEFETFTIKLRTPTTFGSRPPTPRDPAMYMYVDEAESLSTPCGHSTGSGSRRRPPSPHVLVCEEEEDEEEDEEEVAFSSLRRPQVRTRKQQPRVLVFEEEDDTDEEEEQFLPPPPRRSPRKPKSTPATSSGYRKSPKCSKRGEERSESSATSSGSFVSGPSTRSRPSPAVAGPSTRSHPPPAVAGPSTAPIPLPAGRSTRSRRNPTVADPSSDTTPPPSSGRPKKEPRPRDAERKAWVLPPPLAFTANTAERKRYDACMRAAENLAKANLDTDEARGRGRPRQNSWICPYCKQYFSKKYTYDNHIRSCLKLREFPCPDCPLICTSKDALNKHRITHKPVDERIKYTCRKPCTKFFWKASAATRHMRDSKKCPIRRYKKVWPDGSWCYGRNASSGTSSEDDGKRFYPLESVGGHTGKAPKKIPCIVKKPIPAPEEYDELRQEEDQNRYKRRADERARAQQRARELIRSQIQRGLVSVEPGSESESDAEDEDNAGAACEDPNQYTESD